MATIDIAPFPEDTDCVDGVCSATSELSDNLDFLGNWASSQAQAGSEEPAGPIGQQQGSQGFSRGSNPCH